MATTGRTVLIFPYLCNQHNDRAFTVKARSGSVCSIVRACVCVRWLWSCSCSLSLLRLSPWCRWWSRSASISCISRRCPSRTCRTRPGTALCPAGVTSTWARRSASSWCCAAGTEGRRRPSTAPVRKLGAGGEGEGCRPAPDEREDRETVFIYMLVSLIFKQEVMTLWGLTDCVTNHHIIISHVLLKGEFKTKQWRWMWRETLQLNHQHRFLIFPSNTDITHLHPEYKKWPLDMIDRKGRLITGNQGELKKIWNISLCQNFIQPAKE